jgi:hypothetical protein
MGDRPRACGCIHAGRQHRTQIPSSLNRPPHQSQRPTLRRRRKRIVGTPMPVMTNIRPRLNQRGRTPIRYELRKQAAETMAKPRGEKGSRP